MQHPSDQMSTARPNVSSLNISGAMNFSVPPFAPTTSLLFVPDRVEESFVAMPKSAIFTIVRFLPRSKFAPDN